MTKYAQLLFVLCVGFLVSIWCGNYDANAGGHTMLPVVILAGIVVGYFVVKLLGDILGVEE